MLPILLRFVTNSGRSGDQYRFVFAARRDSRGAELIGSVPPVDRALSPREDRLSSTYIIRSPHSVELPQGAGCVFIFLGGGGVLRLIDSDP